MNSTVHLFDIRPAVDWLTDRKLLQQVTGQMVYEGENAPEGTAISYYLRTASTAPVKITISDVEGRVIREMDGTGMQGINRVQWDLSPNPPQGGGGGGGRGGGFGGGGSVDPGTYKVTLTVGNTTLTKTVEVLEDRWMDER
jgi:hypothetical protein